jgi:ABC-2 type transport system ATP-binding protein
MLSLVEDLGRNQNKNVLLCSHLLPDVERTCDNVVVLVKGQAILQGSIAELTAAESRRLRVEVEDGGDRLQAALEAATYATSLSEDGALMVTLPQGVEDADALCGLAAGEGVNISSIDPVRSTLEEVFLKAVDDSERKTEATSA